jgi:nitrite reductase/ring-hydroxylating ferredoxin subunit
MLKKLFFIWLTLLVSGACDKVQNPIPSMSVYLELDVSTKDRELRGYPSYKEYTKSNINPSKERIGFGGVLVVHTIVGEYVAFDRACPYEANSTIAVEVDEDILNAVCPRCGTKYDIATFPGAPNGKSEHYLRQYSITVSGDRLTVRN